MFTNAMFVSLLGFFFLFKDIDNPNIQSFETVPSTAMQLFQMTLGEFKVETQCFFFFFFFF